MSAHENKLPTGNLDSHTTEEIFNVLKQLAREGKIIKDRSRGEEDANCL